MRKAWVKLVSLLRHKRYFYFMYKIYVREGGGGNGDVAIISTGGHVPPKVAVIQHIAQMWEEKGYHVDSVAFHGIFEFRNRGDFHSWNMVPGRDPKSTLNNDIKLASNYRSH
jgi:hypothetical protein